MRCTLTIVMTCCTHLALAQGGAPPLPAAPGRGYAMHPAVAGDRLVFVADGDLWIASLAGDLSKPIQAARLTSGTGMETAPVLSPDGSMVAFLADYDGTPEVYAMPTLGGSPKRLTFHPTVERPLAFTADGMRVIYRSDRANPLGRDELWSVPVSGGPSKPLGFGEGSLAAVDPDTGRIAFTPWSNESWNWKRYRGGTAPDLWVTDAEGRTFTRLTKTRENELFPMWVQGRVWFLSDADGRMNLCSVAADGGDRRQHTRFGTKDLEPRWAKADPGRGGSRIVYTRGADVVLFDAKDGSERALDLRLVGDRFLDRLRNRSALEGLTGFSLAPKASELLLESRGEFLVLPLGEDPGHRALGAVQVPGRGATRERGAAWLPDDRIAFITTQGDSDALVIRDLSDTESGEQVLATSEVWLLDPTASPDGTWIAWCDKDGVLRAANVESGEVAELERGANGVIRDMRFSPDGAWLAWQRPMSNGLGQVVLRNMQTGATAAIGDGMTNDMAPRWDPAGAYLYFLSDRHVDPVADSVDLNFANFETTVVCAVPLQVATPPPSVSEAEEAGMDLKAWASGKRSGWMRAGEDEIDAKAGESEKASESDGADGAKAGEVGEEGAKGEKSGKSGKDEKSEKRGKDEQGAEDAEDHTPITVELDGISDRVHVLPVEPGTFDGFEASPGALLLGRRPLKGVNEEVWPQPAMGTSGIRLERFDVLQGKATPMVEKPMVAWVMDADATHVATWDGDRLALHAVGGGEAVPLSTEGLAVEVDPRLEWRQMFDEAWRLQRDFFWRADMGGVDWAAVRQMYLPMVDRVGTRQELNDLIGQMSGELGNSHVYISGGEEFRRSERSTIATLGADVQVADGGWRIVRVLPDFSASGGEPSPLAAAFRRVKPGEFIVEVDGRAVSADQDLGALLVGRAGRPTLLTIAKDAEGDDARVLEVTLPSGDTDLRYRDWVETNRRAVAQRSAGRLGYLHVPDMGSPGITAFTRGFFPQTDRDGLVVDIRNNGGGYVSPVLSERLARKPWAYSVPRNGRTETNPSRTMVGPIAVLIDQNAGSDGDIFPQTMRDLKAGTLIGTRTWGGVVGIEGDKPFVDGGMATQPGWGYWTRERGYAVENDGVAPDVEVEITPADRAAGRDPQLDKAIETLQAQLPAKRFVPPRPETTPPTAPAK